MSSNTHGNAAGIGLSDQTAEHAGRAVRKALVNQGFKNQIVAHGTRLGIDVEVAERNPQDKGFLSPPRRWKGQQPCGILIRREPQAVTA
ncbi:hypothetical protein [Streptomyces sp. 4N124]|uniref:hypothetical protein n=1 Tax=Streptomyces sp. 4N124 TaxID=3457420 RepID=UPI003FCF6DDE